MDPCPAEGEVKKLAVVVPTYWGPVREYELGVPSPACDHPTPLGSQGTLPRLLESLARNRGVEFEVLLVVAPAESRPTPCEALRRDVVRFIYKWEKLAHAVAQGLPLRLELGPYPGRFLKGDVEREASRALESTCGWEAAHREEFLEIVKNWARSAAPTYFHFAARWQGFTSRLLRGSFPPSSSLASQLRC